MESWITTRQLLLHQDAKLSPTRNQEAVNLGYSRSDGYSLGPTRHHDRCQNVYISTTTSNRIVDTLEFFPHNYQMPQLSSTDQLLMAAKDMTDAFQNPHPDVPFACVGDDTIAALVELAAIFKLKLQHALSPVTPASPAKVLTRPSLIPSPTGGKRDHRRQITLKTSQMCHYL
jgi:hypothetical protein